MSCKIEHKKYQGIESPLGEKLLEIYKDLSKAKEVYDTISSSEFIDKFGDWINEDISNRTNELYEPLLVEKIGLNNSKDYYFLDKNEDPIDLIVREFSSFETDNLTNEIKEITEQISSYIFKKYIKENFDNITSIKKINVSSEINEFVDLKINEYEDIINSLDSNEDISIVKETIDYLKLIKDHNSEFTTEIINFFNSKKLKINQDIVEDDIQTSQNDGLQGGDITQSFEKNSKDNATANVKLLLSFLPRYDYDNNNNVFEKSYGSALGEELFIPMDVVHKELLKELSDIITLNSENGVSDVYEQMIGVISNLSNKKYYYRDLLSLLDNISEDKKTEFVSAFFNSKINFYTSIIKGKEYSSYKSFNSTEQKSKADKLLNEWNITFRSNFIDDTNKSFNLKKLETLSSRFNELIISLNKERKGLDFNTITDQEFINKFQDITQGLIDGFNYLGITDLTEEGFNLFLNRLDTNNESNSYLIMFNKLQGTLIKTQNMIKSLSSNPKNIQVNPFREYKSAIFKSLSEAEAFYKEDGSEDTIISGGKMYWTFSRPSYISNTINKIKQSPEVLEEITNITINKNSVFARHLLGKDKSEDGDYLFDEQNRSIKSNSRIEKLELGIFNSFEEEGDSINSDDNTTISYVDQLVDELNKVLIGGIKNNKGRKVGNSSIYSTSQAADKSTRYEIKIDHFITDTISNMNNGSITFSDEVLDIFTDYYLDEVNRMKEAFKELDNLSKEDYKVFYHSDKNGNIRNSEGFLIGNAFTSQIFPELSPTKEFISSKINEEAQIFDINGDPLFLDYKKFTATQRSVIKQNINGILYNRIKNNFDDFINIGIAKKNINAETSKEGYKIRGIDTKILNSYKEEYETDLNIQSLVNLISDYTINSVIANVEYTKLFTGDPAYYKNMIDFFKRVPSTYTDGINLRLGISESDSIFKIAVLENQIIESKYIDEISKSLDITNITNLEKEYVLGAYREVNQTDAQAWITPKRWAFLVNRLGKWNDKYDSVYNKMIGEDTNPFTVDELKFVAQPLKGVYFGVVNGVPTYLKYSQAVIFPQLVKGSQLENLLSNMERNSIDESITLDGVKVGANVPNSITDTNGDILSNINFNTLTLNNSEWKLQQDLPTKLLKSTLLGSQIQKNILNSIDITNDNAVYKMQDGSLLTSNEILQSINDTLSDLSNKGIDKLSVELGKDELDRIDVDKFYSVLESELLDKEYPINMVKSIQKNLPIDSIPGIKDKMYNLIFSRIKKAAVKIKTNGGSFIQMSNFGLDKITAEEKGVKWLVEPSELKPPLLTEDLDGSFKVTPGQVFLPHSEIVKSIPNYEKLSTDKLNSIIDSRLLRAIGYRIPNQGMSSNDPLQIVGILPASVGDTIVAYTEIPTKTGSDFDIDKMYVMLPSSKVKLSNRSFNKAYKYIQDNEYTEEEIIDELSYYGFTKETLEGRNLKKLFASVVLLDNESDSLYQSDFLDSIEEGDIEKIEYISFDDGSNLTTKQLQNKLFELYWSVLVNKDTYADLITPIDFPHVKDHIKQLHGDNSKQTGEFLKFYDPIFQLKLKKIYIGGKSGVGLTANMLVDHVRSKSINLKFNNLNLGVGHSNSNLETVFDEEYSETIGESKFKISHTISAFLNAFVDNAKDPYINDGNYNTYTSNVAFMLIRSGVHPNWINAFIGQPVLKELVDFTDIYESKSIPKEKPWLSSFDIIYDKYLSEFNKLNGTDYDKLKYNVSDFSLNKLENLIKNKDSETSDFYESQIQILSIFKSFQDLSKKLAESVQLSRFDTEGAGKDNLDMLIYINRVKEILYKQNEDSEIGNHIEKYVNNGKLTSLGTQLLNTLEYSRKILESNPELFLLASENINNLYNNISSNLINSYGNSRGLLKDKNLGKLLNNELYSYIMSDFSKFKVEDNPLIFIKNTIKDIVNYKDNESELDIDEKNLFIENLDFFDNSFGIFSRNMSKDYKDSLYRSFRDLYENNPILADKIITSLYLQNGFNRNLIDFKEFIPHEWFIQNDIRGFFRKKNTELISSLQTLSPFIKQLVTSNIDNNILSPVITKRTYKYLKINGKNINLSEGFTLDTSDITTGFNRYILGKTKDDRNVFVNYLKLEDQKLYELQGYINNNPVYTRINKTGHVNSSNFLNIREYNYNSDIKSKFNTDSNKYDQIVKNVRSQEDFIDASQLEINNNIQDFYIKDLSDILLSEINVVSLEEVDENNLPNCLE